jgi:excisionase family DNA binding protein
VKTQPQPDQRFLTAQEFAEALGVPTSTVTRAIVRGELAGKKAGKVYRIPRSELERITAAGPMVTRWRIKVGKLLDEVLTTAEEIRHGRSSASLLGHALDAISDENPRQLTAAAQAALARHLAATRALDQAVAATPLLEEVLAAREGPIAWARRRVAEIQEQRSAETQREKEPVDA